MMIRGPKKSDLRGVIQYAGVDGITRPCVDAIVRLIQYRENVTVARLLSCSKRHSFLLTIDENDLIAIRGGFASGYGGEGPKGLSYVLSLLETHGVTIEEFEVPQGLLNRLNRAALTCNDVDYIQKCRPVRPTRWISYVCEDHGTKSREGRLWEQEFRPVIPLAIVDPRLADLARSFWNAPGASLDTGYRRLEGTVRQRTGINEYGTKLFSAALRAKPPMLTWNTHEASEQEGMASLFIGAFMAFRNPRAHHELEDDTHRQLHEFLLLNHLYALEAQAVVATIANPDQPLVAAS